MSFILASQSPRRVDLLKQIGYENFTQIPANIDETPLEHETPRLLAERLAYAKILAVAGRDDVPSDRVLLALDTVVGVGRRILNAPQTKEEVISHLTLLSHRSHRVYTAVFVRNSQGRFLNRVCEARLIFKRLTPQEIEAYAESGEGIGKAGGYAIQGRAGAFLKTMTGSPFTVIGLPLKETQDLLTGVGILSHTTL
jgi:septum formation protein